VEKQLGGISARQLSVALVIALLMCVFVWGAIYARMAERNVRIDKDLLFLYLCGVEMSDSTLHDEQIELVNQLVSISASDHLIYRAKLRASYCNNYPFTSLSMYAAAKVQSYFGITDPEKDFPTFLLSSMRWGMTLSGGVLGVLCLVCAFWAAKGDPPLMLATFGAVALAALLYVIIPSPSLSWMLLKAPPVRNVNPQDILGLGLYTWLHPSGAFSPLSVFPRCLCAMLTFAAFNLRWSGHSGAAYWFPLIVCFVHQSEAPILLAVMIACDLAVRPRSLTRSAYVIPIILTIVVIALRERMFSTLGFSGLTAGIILALIASLAILLFAIPSAKSVITSRWVNVNRWRARFYGRFPLPFAEALVIVSIWFAVLVICFLFRKDTFYRVIYFWSELPSRYVGLFQLTVFAGLTYPVWRAVVSWRPRAVKEATAIISCLMLLLAVNQWRHPWDSMTVLANQTRQFEETIAKGYAGDSGSFSRVETPFYYLLVRRAFLGGEGTAEYFAKGRSTP
jgi:hypothetical protein